MTNSLTVTSYETVPVPQLVTLAIKPGSERTCFTQNDHGVIPVAILGSAALDVSEIVIESLSLQGLAGKMAGKNHQYLAHIENARGDEYPDLVVQFQISENWIASGNGIAPLTGRLSDGTLIRGSDSICIAPKVKST